MPPTLLITLNSACLLRSAKWKVQCTLAFFHELAVILGDQLTAAHLLPVFNGFLKDLDGVQIGVLKHLYDFLKVVAILQKFCSNNDSALGFCFIMNSSYGSGTVLSGSEGKHLLSFVSLPATCPPVPVF
ncbi:unnamed protein product [Rangifer tarandus platyrhynchus]|uniref:Uncharacterized protein n=1 Tax=Rangifer tarandus platyrhynchus TaxID=3082113 RepID=A0ABN8XYG4_RANTA|nr:unnamed protein product [Rangifer tarandus platyrhynchus]